MKHIAFLVSALLPIVSVHAADVIPQNLVGVWATDASVMRGSTLSEGTAVYLGKDGAGAIVGGPPTIGIRIAATYNAQTRIIDFKIAEAGQAREPGKMEYDPASNHIKFNNEKLNRKFPELTETTRKALGLKPTK
ncbi:MAG: hypothetical protein ACRDAM_00160 [Casimicrobium sp.]